MSNNGWAYRITYTAYAVFIPPFMPGSGRDVVIITIFITGGYYFGFSNRYFAIRKCLIIRILIILNLSIGHEDIGW
jgi:hypothetical protein